MKRTIVVAALLAVICGANSQMQPIFDAGRAIGDLVAPKNLNSLEGIKREIRRQKLKGNPPGILGAYLEFYRARAYPNDTFDWSEYAKGALDRSAMQPIRKPLDRGKEGPAGIPAGNWAFVGPRNTNPGYQVYFGDRAIMGRINSLAMAPNPNRTEARSRVLYAASAGGGVWRTSDGGANWTALSDTSQHWRFLQVGAIAVTNTVANSPQVATDVIIAGTGDPRGIYRLIGFGVMRSTDGGATWEAPKQLGAGEQLPVTSIVVDPDEPGRITLTTGGSAVATNNGDNMYPPPSRQDYMGSIWQSTNFGQTWTQVLGTNAYWSRISIGARDRDGKRRYWAVGWDGGGNAFLRVSLDKGATWDTPANPPGGLNVGDPWSAHLDICASKSAPQTAYLTSGSDRRIYITENGGSSWTNITNNFPATYAGTANDNWSQSSYDYYVEAVPIPGGNKDLLLVGLITLAAAVRNDATGVWNWVDIGVTGTAGAKIHNDQHCAVYDRRDSSRFFVGHDGGVHEVRFDRNVAFGGGAFTFTNRSATLHVTQFYEAAWHPTTADSMIGGTQDNMSPRSIGAGGATINAWVGEGGGDGSGSVISFSNPNIQLTLANMTGVFYTSDGWATNGSANIVSSGNNSFFPPTAMDVLGNYYWCDDRVRQFTTNGANLNGVYNSGVLTAGTADAHITALGQPLANPAILYVGSSDGAIFVSRDATAAAPTFTRIDRTAAGAVLPNGSPPNRYVTDIAVDPFDANRVVVSFSGIGLSTAPVTDHVYRCNDTSLADANRAWVNVDNGANKLPNLPINTLVWDNSPKPAVSGVLQHEDLSVVPIPDNDPNGITRTITLNQDVVDIVTRVRVILKIDGTFNGDLRVRLEHGGQYAILLNGTGRDGGPFGYGDDGFDIILDDDPGNVNIQGDVHTYRTVTGVLPAGQPLTGEWQADGRDVPIATVAFATPRTQRLNIFQGLQANGPWHLTLSDNAAGNAHTLVQWGIIVHGLRGDGTLVQRVYAGGDAGAFYTSDISVASPVWVNATQPIGLPNVQVNDLEHVTATGFLNAATFGRGMWRVPIGTAEINGMMAHPTRFQGGGDRTTTLRVVLSKPAPAGGTTVHLTTSDAVRLPVPATLAIPAGQVTATVILTSPGAPPAGNTPVTIGARVMGERRRTIVVLTP